MWTEQVIVRSINVYIHIYTHTYMHAITGCGFESKQGGVYEKVSRYERAGRNVITTISTIRNKQTKPFIYVWAYTFHEHVVIREKRVYIMVLFFLHVSSKAWVWWQCLSLPTEASSQA